MYAVASVTLGRAIDFEFMRGLAAVWVWFGIAAWGIVAGIAVAKSGMGTALAILMSILVYAGSAQVVVLPLIVAEAPLWVIWGTTLCVCLRFVAFSYHLRPYFAHLSRPRRACVAYLMGDTIFALFVRRFPEPGPSREQDLYYVGAAAASYSAWQASIITGIVAGSAIPESWGVGFAGTMALLALTSSLLRSPSTWIAAIVAGCAAVAAYALPLRLNIVVAVAAAIAFGALAQKLPLGRAGAAP
jgi:predicted branched-subunit amino acid permease